jgi:hypothetical protein
MLTCSYITRGSWKWRTRKKWMLLIGNKAMISKQDRARLTILSIGTTTGKSNSSLLKNSSTWWKCRSGYEMSPLLLAWAKSFPSCTKILSSWESAEDTSFAQSSTRSVSIATTRTNFARNMEGPSLIEIGTWWGGALHTPRLWVYPVKNIELRYKSKNFWKIYYLAWRLLMELKSIKRALITSHIRGKIWLSTGSTKIVFISNYLKENSNS